MRNRVRAWILVSLLVGIAFMSYNGVLGVMYGAVWNISICIYYLILLVIKLHIPPIDWRLVSCNFCSMIKNT